MPTSVPLDARHHLEWQFTYVGLLASEPLHSGSGADYVAERDVWRLRDVGQRGLAWSPSGFDAWGGCGPGRFADVTPGTVLLDAGTAAQEGRPGAALIGRAQVGHERPGVILAIMMVTYLATAGAAGSRSGDGTP